MPTPSYIAILCLIQDRQYESSSIRQVTEWEFTADIASRINGLLQQNPELPFSEARAEARAKGSAKRRDLTLYDRANKPVLTGEVKMPDNPQGRNPFHQTVVEDAHRKADAIGVNYNFTWNVNRFVLWNTYEQGKPITERAVEHFPVLPAPIADSDDVLQPRVKTQIDDFLLKFLQRFAALLSGEAPLRLLPLDEKFIIIYEASLEQPIAQTLATLSQQYERSREAMRRALPPQLQPDTFDGQAWIGVVPFGMSRVYPRYTFPVPGLSDFLELNTRTYVTLDGKPGVFFFSLDAANPLAVALARAWYKLPYFNAQMRMSENARPSTSRAIYRLPRSAQGASWIDYHSTRTHRGEPSAEFKGRYRPVSDVFHSQPGSLEGWLTERYCLYTVVDGKVFRGEIHHAQWPLQRAEAEIETNTMAAPTGLTLPNVPPLLHFAREIKMVAWGIGRVVP
ncbi:MAG: YqjF family protein [Anaerolineales bacterium]